jgi:hypothetical protein
VYKEEKDVEKTKGKESTEERRNLQQNKLPLTNKGRKNEPLNQIVTFLLMTL